MKRFKSFTMKKKIVTAGLALGIVLGTAGTAFAYFSSTGSGTGTATVGSSSPWVVAVAAPTGGPLLPGSGTETFTYTVTNSGTGAQGLNATAASVANSGTGGACLATWFTVTNTSISGDVAGGGHLSSSVTVQLTDTTANQDACQGVSPILTVTAS